MCRAEARKSPLSISLSFTFTERALSSRLFPSALSFCQGPVWWLQKPSSWNPEASPATPHARILLVWRARLSGNKRMSFCSFPFLSSNCPGKVCMHHPAHLRNPHLRAALRYSRRPRLTPPVSPARFLFSFSVTGCLGGKGNRTTTPPAPPGFKSTPGPTHSSGFSGRLRDGTRRRRRRPDPPALSGAADRRARRPGPGQPVMPTRPRPACPSRPENPQGPHRVAGQRALPAGLAYLPPASPRRPKPAACLRRSAKPRRTLC